ncbi:Sapep family Mn(2+)-dependent dipeptidase [Anaerovoracaceae bacterium 42-11]
MEISEVKSYMEKQCESMIKDLAEFVSIPSVAENRQDVKRALRYILNLARTMGFDAKSVLDESVGVIELGDGAETIGILSHVDVVPPGNPNVWRTPPFTLVQKDGRLYGRGAIDDKGAIIACLYAMKAVKDSGIPMHKKIQMILGTQEETEWTDMQAYVKLYPLPDYGFTPDGEFPVCNIEKGCMSMRISFPLEKITASGLYVTELTSDCAVNTVPGICTAKISHYEEGREVLQETVEATGRSVHGCQPEKGENAVFNMVQKLRAFPLAEDGVIWKTLRQLEKWFSDLYGDEIGLSNEQQYINGEYVDKNVFSPTKIYTTKNTLEVYLDIRYAYGADDKKIIDTIASLAGNCGGEAQVITNMPAVYVDRNRPFMQAFAEAYEEGCGRTHEFVLAYGGSYAKAMPNIVSWGPIFPGEEDTCHEENEYISKKSLLENSVIFAAALAKIALSEKSFK